MVGPGRETKRNTKHFNLKTKKRESANLNSMLPAYTTGMESFSQTSLVFFC
jgi:hypothetical protein